MRSGRNNRGSGKVLAISLREIARMLNCSKPTAQDKLLCDGIMPVRYGTGTNAKLWYPRRDVERFIRRLRLE